MSPIVKKFVGAEEELAEFNSVLPQLAGVFAVVTDAELLELLGPDGELIGLLRRMASTALTTAETLEALGKLLARRHAVATGLTVTPDS